MAVDYYANKSQDHISLAELDLYHRIMAYRRDNGLPDVILSKGLSTTAGRHALDTVENMGVYSGHSWSDAPFPPNESMWLAPSRLGTSYQGAGTAFYAYEITAGWTDVTNNPYSPQNALSAWQNSPPHNAVILNLDTWSDNVWKAIGVGMLDGIAHVWFGGSSDPGGVPTIQGSAAGDTVDGTRFKDIVQGKAGNDIVNGAAGSDSLLGDAGNDTLKGGNNNDVLQGGVGNDRLEGGNGNDRLLGDKGADTLVGGKGADKFSFRKVSDSTTQPSGMDTAKDFKRGHKDKIDLAAMDADRGIGGNQAFAFIGKAKFSGDAGEVRYVKKNGDTFVYGDVDGDKKGDFALRLDASIDLTKADFML
jgi:Ca2+-binding RTX toxin-like protein